MKNLVICLLLFRQIYLILLHPFIPFLPKRFGKILNLVIILKNHLMFKDWDLKSQSNFNKSYSKIDWLIDLVSNIRSTKVNLNVSSAGSFIDISTFELMSSLIKKAL